MIVVNVNLHFVYRNIGIVTLVFGFVAIVDSLLYCMCICQEGKHLQPKHNGQVGKLSKLLKTLKSFDFYVINII